MAVICVYIWGTNFPESTCNCNLALSKYSSIPHVFSFIMLYFHISVKCRSHYIIIPTLIIQQWRRLVHDAWTEAKLDAVICPPNVMVAPPFGSSQLMMGNKWHLLYLIKFQNFGNQVKKGRSLLWKCIF